MTRILRGAAAAMLSTVFGLVALAQEAQEQFVPAESLPREEIPPGPLLYGAYAFVWAVFIVYVFLLWRRLSRVERELSEVGRRLGEKV